jgi:hypothetical protein
VETGEIGETMKVKMKEFYRDSQHAFPPEQVVDETMADDELLAWLVEHNKAVEVNESPRHLNVEPQFEQAEEPPHYGAQAEPQLKDDEAIHEVMHTKAEHPKSKRLKGRKGREVSDAKNKD